MKNIILCLLSGLIAQSCCSGVKSNDLVVDEMSFKAIPAGQFTMGADQGSADEQPSHKVVISQAFWLAKYELTQGQWKNIMGSSIVDQRNKTNPEWSLRGEGVNHPIYYISWKECQVLIKKLNQLYSKKLPEGYEFALPSEAQWEYACRAGGANKPSGDLENLAWFDGNSDEQCHAVGQKAANAWGLHDMYGNVWEWCADAYDHYTPEDKVDPKGPVFNDVHVNRGASWHEGAGGCYASKRDWYSADGRLYNLGVRLAITAKK